MVFTPANTGVKEPPRVSKGLPASLGHVLIDIRDNKLASLTDELFSQVEPETLEPCRCAVEVPPALHEDRVYVG